MYFLFYFILYPLSILPLGMLYLVLSPFYVILALVVRYRRKIIDDNFSQSFPEWTHAQVVKARYRYYWHFMQIAAEMVKMLTMSRRNVMRRYRCSNPELVNRYFDQGKSVVLMSSHHNNWEWMVLSVDMQFKHHGIGVGAHNTNKTFEKLINRARTRYGDEVVFHDNVRERMAYYKEHHVPVAYMILSDQSPSNPKRCYVTDFLHRKTGFIRGSEGFARKYDMPVLYYEVVKERMGKYRIDIKEICEHPNELPEGAVMQRYVELLEQTIRKAPYYWLWSHRRWKHKFE